MCASMSSRSEPSHSERTGYTVVFDSFIGCRRIEDQHRIEEHVCMQCLAIVGDAWLVSLLSSFAAKNWKQQTTNNKQQTTNNKQQTTNNDVPRIPWIFMDIQDFPQNFNGFHLNFIAHRQARARRVTKNGCGTISMSY